MFGLEPQLRERLEQVLEHAITDVRRVESGYTPALRLRVCLVNAKRVFVKLATTDSTAQWLRAEREVYESLSGSFMPHCLGWDDDGQCPLLVLEDLGDAYWPPPWTGAHVRQVLDTLQQLARARVPHLPLLRDQTHLLDGWQRVAAEPAPFLSLGLAGARWLDAALPRLLDVDAQTVAEGDAVLHNDVRSDNIAFANGRTVFVD